MPRANIIFILIMTTLLHSRGISADEFAKDKAACNQSHQEWNDQLNSCTYTQEAIDFSKRADTCSNSPNPMECHIKLAESKSGVSQGDSYNESKLAKKAKIAASSYALFFYIAGKVIKTAVAKIRPKITQDFDMAIKPEHKSGCMSKALFNLTTVAWISGDLFLKYKAKKEFEKLAEQYEEDSTTGESSYQSQVLAFEVLKKEQDLVLQQANLRSKLQMVASLGYGSSLLFAVGEVLNPAIACKTFGTIKATPTDPTLNEALDMAEGHLQAGQISFAKKILNLGNSKQYLFGSGVMLGLSASITKHALEEKERVLKNIEMLDDHVETYANYKAGFCPNGREDIQEADCYCYNSDGSKNSSRTNSDICRVLYAQNDIDYSKKLVKIGSSDTGPKKGCITVTGQFDLECKCSEMINNTTKRNACLDPAGISILSSGSLKNALVKDSIKISSNLGDSISSKLGALSSSSLGSKVAALRNGLAISLKKAKTKQPKIKDLKEIERDLSRIALGNPKARAIANLKDSFGTRKAFEANLPSSSNQSKRKAYQNNSSISNQAPTGEEKRQGLGKIGSKSNNQIHSNNYKGSNPYDTEVMALSEEELSVEGQDITNEKNKDLWKIISRRYQTSGLKRLFDD